MNFINLIIINHSNLYILVMQSSLPVTKYLESEQKATDIILK
jgi:hypothetical protein